MTTMIECACGRVLRVHEPTPGKRVRCPHCGSVLIIPERPTAAPEDTSLKGPVDGFDESVTSPSEPLKLQTPMWLLYFGLLTAAAIAWGAFATWKLQVRTVQMEESRMRAEDAVSAAKAVTDHAAGIRKEAENNIRKAIPTSEKSLRTRTLSISGMWSRSGSRTALSM